MHELGKFRVGARGRPDRPPDSRWKETGRDSKLRSPSWLRFCYGLFLLGKAIFGSSAALRLNANRSAANALEFLEEDLVSAAASADPVSTAQFLDERTITLQGREFVLAQRVQLGIHLGGRKRPGRQVLDVGGPGRDESRWSNGSGVAGWIAGHIGRYDPDHTRGELDPGERI